jgi:hypothetical protein
MEGNCIRKSILNYFIRTKTNYGRDSLTKKIRIWSGQFGLVLQTNDESVQHLYRDGTKLKSLQYSHTSTQRLYAIRLCPYYLIFLRNGQLFYVTGG